LEKSSNIYITHGALSVYISPNNNMINVIDTHLIRCNLLHRC